MLPRRSIWTLLAAVAFVHAAKPVDDLSRYALTDTGSVNGGNTFPGVSRPLGMVKLGPDLYTGADAYSGYLPTGNFTGFTMLHESGTGGAPKYGVVSQMPVVGHLANPLSDAVNDTRAAPDRTEVGYYRAALGSGTTGRIESSGGCNSDRDVGVLGRLVARGKQGLQSLLGGEFGERRRRRERGHARLWLGGGLWRLFAVVRVYLVARRGVLERVVPMDMEAVVALRGAGLRIVAAWASIVLVEVDLA
ncbi:glycoside hydrolase family 92 [Ophiocordyceps sinensis CO18]|uniref:Glycoside hydrolase family 92 n=1 Tax=Ophiocordyceps sinensis (strain Co18 / CGMCC 3.14243) TaxID=911162 RepID=T5A7R9_OPHSC|nr:glycoside hydrolase family 92 [Ophiocordyceps sinensis CO18]